MGPFIKSIAFALVFFALGRIIVIQMGNKGIWMIAIGLIIFYTIWWAFNRRDKNK